MDILTLFAKKKVEFREQNISTLIGEGCHINGDIKAKNSIRIDGTVEGNVESEQGLILGEKGVIKGDVKTQEVVVYGTINGNVSSKQLIIKALGKIKGSIVTKNIQIDIGAIYNGYLSMSSDETQPEKPSSFVE